METNEPLLSQRGFAGWTSSEDNIRPGTPPLFSLTTTLVPAPKQVTHTHASAGLRGGITSTAPWQRASLSKETDDAMRQSCGQPTVSSRLYTQRGRYLAVLVQRLAKFRAMHTYVNVNQVKCMAYQRDGACTCLWLLKCLTPGSLGRHR